MPKTPKAPPRRVSAAAEYALKKAAFAGHVAELQQMLDADFGHPAAPHWGHVGDLGEWNRTLAQVTDCYFKRGQWAPVKGR